MNAIDLLKEDHRIVDDLFKRVEDTPPSRHPPIFKKIKNELDTHAHIEEKVFYPVLVKDGNKELVEITTEGIEEHSQIKKFLREIGRTSSTGTREAKLKVLMEDTRHHVKEEEDEMFPMVEDQFTPEALEKLGERMEAERQKFQKAKRIPGRRQPPKGKIQTLMAGAKDLVAAALLMGGDSKAAKPNGKKSGSRKAGPPASGSKKPSAGNSKKAGAKAATSTSKTSAKASAGKKKAAGSRSRSASK